MEEPKKHTHKSPLFNKEHHPRQPKNVNELHKQNVKDRGINARLALIITESVGTMYCAYFFAGLAVVGLVAILGILPTLVALLVVWISQTFLQLTLLSVIMVGQGVQAKKSEIQADESFKTTMSSYNDIEHIMAHLSAQDDELLRQDRMLIHLLEKEGISLQQLEAELHK